MSRGNISKQVVTSFGCLIIVLLALTPVSMGMSNSSVPGAVHSFVSITLSLSPSFSQRIALSSSLGTIPSPSTNTTPSLSTNSPSISTNTTPSISTSPSISTRALPSVRTRPSISTNGSPSVIISPSISTNASTSVIISPSISTNASTSVSTSLSLSGSVSLSVSSIPSISTSGSPSVSTSPSISTSVSPLAIMSPSISTSASPSVSTRPFILTSASPSAIISPSTSNSTSPSVSANPSLSISASPSVSTSLSFSTSASPSVSTSRSISTNASPLVSASPSLSTSVSTSVNGSLSVPNSVSPSVSISPSFSTSVSPSVSKSPSISTSVSPSVSTSRSISTNVSPSVIMSGSPSIFTSVSQIVIASPSASAGVPPSSVSNIKSVTSSTALMSLSSRIATPTAPFIPIDIYTAITIPENKGIVLNCTKDRFDGKHEWSRKDGEPAVTTTRILTEDTRLNITDASVEDAGEYICRNGQTVTHRFVITVEVFVKVQMIVKVLNYEYTPELQNKSSPAYKATEKNFTAEMDKLYKNTPGYVRTEVLNFTKGSVNVDFRVIIVINATDPKNASAIPDAKAKTTHQVVREAKTGFVKQLQVSPVVEVFSPPLEPRGIEIFEEKSDKLGVRWEPSEDADAFKVESYHVQYRELLTKIPQNASVPSTEKKDTYSYLIKDLEPKTTYMIRVGAENRHGINFNEETAHETLDPPFAKWIIVLIVLGILLVTGIIVGLIVFTRRRAEQRRKKLKEEEDGRFGGLSGDVRLASVPNYETRNVKGIKFSFANKSFMPSEANWKEIPYEKITLMNELGSGAFGVVYKGELKQDNGNVTPCAVKTLKESATTEEIRDLYNELEIMTNVGYHPNLVNLLGACTQDGPLLVVIEIAENGNLLELLRKSRETNQNYGNIQGTVLTSNTRLRIAADVAKGMAHLANGRWIHRDLAARNVLLAKNYVAKVADYGMARDIYEQLMYKKETQGKLPVKWMAIESLETYIFTTESDVWSYGVLLWEMESGGLKPYAGLSTTELIDQLKKGYRLEKPDGCSDAVYQIMRDCWNPNPKSRPTFDDLVTRLENMAVSS